LESALKDPRGASPCLLGVYGIFTFFFSTYRQTLLQQVQRDDNVQTLLDAIREAFEFAEEADPLRNIRPESRQATILEEMLECVSQCAKFITLYAEDVQVGMYF
jgi:hypothetical protein